MPKSPQQQHSIFIEKKEQDGFWAWRQTFVHYSILWFSFTKIKYSVEKKSFVLLLLLWAANGIITWMVHMMYEISMLRTVYVDGRVSVNVCALKSVSILCRKNILMEWHSKAKILNHGMMFHYRFLSLSVFLKKTERERERWGF